MTYEIDLVDLTPRPTAVVRGHVAHDGIAAFLGPVFGETAAAISAQHLDITGPPFACYRAAGDGGWDVEAGFPSSAPVTADGRVEPGTLPGGRAAHTLHVGSYGELGAAYGAVATWLEQQDVAATGTPWESYLDGPDVARPRTEVFFPCG